MPMQPAWRKRFGGPAGKSRFLYVTVGTGIGVAVILDGVIYRGAGAAHPEIGHQVVEAGGPSCYCGARGCWEIMASGPALLAWANHHLARQQPERGPITMPELCALAEAGDPTALEVMQREGYYLGLGLANLVNIFCPDGIALGGGVMQSSHLFLGPARQVIGQCCTLVPFEKTAVERAALGAEAALVGAAQVWHYRCGPARNQHEF